MDKMKNIETILKRLIENPKFKGNMVEDTQDMYDEVKGAGTFQWIDSRYKPTWAELEAEYHVFLKEQKIKEVESEKRKFLDYENVIVSGIEIYDRVTKTWSA